MGGGSFSPREWDDHKTTRSYATKSINEITASGLQDALDPKKIKLRESRDSATNPKSTPVILGLDVTGSMGFIADAIARNGLPVLMKEIYDRKPINDPHIAFMGIGDVESDQAPLQVSQFEADIRIGKSLEQLFLEHGGGGNSYESYALPWYFAATRIQSDSYAKRQKKGYLFTFGDEGPTPILRKADLAKFLGDTPQADLELPEILTLASREWEIFHVIIEEGDYARSNKARVRDAWTKVLGQRAIPLSDHTKLAEVVVSTLQINEGAEADAVVGSWDGKTSLVVRESTKDLAKGGNATGKPGLASL